MTKCSQAIWLSMFLSIFENKIYELTKEILQEIEDSLKKENRFPNGEKILFTIVKNIK